MNLFDNWLTRASQTRGHPGMVARQSTSLLNERGWKQLGDSYSGPYALKKRGTWQGRIEKRGDIFTPLIKNPPEVVRLHPKFHCFHQTDDRGWWRIHLQRQPADAHPASVIAYVEQILEASFRLAE